MSEVRYNSEQERLSLALSSAEMGTWDWDVHTGVSCGGTQRCMPLLR